jgi:hypothetical protein
VRIFPGGYIDKSTEEYTYVRGRGRGRYVYEECGIRCKKPSMLKKHIRTHTAASAISVLKRKEIPISKKYFLIEFEYSRL